MKIPRTKELIQVGYYLSRFGLEDPPIKLKIVDSKSPWKDAYRTFYDSLNDGRSVLEFEHSLKNSRDDFDGYFSNNRQGWKDDKGEPNKLTLISQEVFDEFLNKTEEDIWSIIEKFSNNRFKVRKEIFNDLIAEDISNSDSNTVTEGGVKMRISKVIERNSKLRQNALDIHGYKCQVCSFDFEEKYGIWGTNFAEVHHIKPLSEFKGNKTETNPKTDLAVLCANCHRMIHRASSKGITLSIDELKEKII